MTVCIGFFKDKQPDYMNQKLFECPFRYKIYRGLKEARLLLDGFLNEFHTEQ